MAVQMLGIKTKFTDDQGRPLVGGKVHAYFSGTTTYQDTFKDPDMTIVNTNPIILDDSGSADVYLNGSYRIRIFDKNDVLIEEQDGVTQSASGEITTAKGEIIGLYGAVLNSLTNEVKRAVAAEKTIADSLTSETTRAKAAESALQSSIDAETTRAKAAESDLNADIIKEVSDRESEVTRLDEADAVLQAQINSVGGGKLAYKTYAEMIADESNISAKSSIDVLADPDDKNGTYLYDGTDFVKSQYDLENIITSKVQNTFSTYTQMTASNLNDGAYALVADDVDDKNGLYIKENNEWVKSKYDVISRIDKAIKDSYGEINNYITGEIVNYASADFSEISSLDELDGFDVSGMTVTNGRLASSQDASRVSPERVGVFNHSDSISLTIDFDTSNQNNAQAGSCGVYVQKKAVGSDGVVFIYKRESSLLMCVKTKGSSLSELDRKVLEVNADVQRWSFVVTNTHDGGYECCMVIDGEIVGSLNIARAYETTDSSYSQYLGVYAGGAGLVVDRLYMDDNTSLVERDVDNIGAMLSDFSTKTASFDANKLATLPLPSGLVDVQYKDSETLIIDDFRSLEEEVDVASYSIPHKKSTIVGEGYDVIGTADWAVSKQGLVPTGIGSDTTFGGYGVAGIKKDLPLGWYHNMRGVRIKARVVIPDKECKVAIFAENTKAAKDTEETSALMASFDSRRVVLESRSTANNTIYNNRHALELLPEYQGDRVVDFTVDLYSSYGRGDVHDLIIADIADTRVARHFFNIGESSNELSPIHTIKSVGIGVDTSSPYAKGVRVLSFEVMPVPRAGSSRYRSLPPEPAPVVPDFSEPQMVFDAVEEAHAEANNGLVGVLGPSVVPMLDYADKLGVTPIDNYYMYYSTNHARADDTGGIWLSTAPTPTGPWTKYMGSAGKNSIYIDTVEGSQTEQPQVVYDDVENRLIMMYHNGGVSGRQVTMLATSNDGINFERKGRASNASDTLRSTLIGHDGYSSFCSKDPLGIVSGWHGWFRLSGGATAEGLSSLWSTARSDDGVNWTSDLLPIYIPSFSQPQHNQQRLDNVAYGAVPFAYRGQRLFPISPFISGGVGYSDGYLAIVRLGDDMRNMSADEYVIEKTLPTEVGPTMVSSVFIRGNTLYLYYIASTRYLHLITADLSAPPKGVNRAV